MIAVLDLVFWLYVTLRCLPALRAMAILNKKSEAGETGALPTLSVVVAARDEERKVGTSVASMLRQDYPDVEVIAVDDRSADGTGEVLRELAGRHANLRVLRVDELPGGWLGKTHALYRGASEASGEWLLFTDADVILSPGCLHRALGYAATEQLDHITLIPRLTSGSVLLRSYVAAFQLAFSISQRPWKARDPYSAVHVGVGAFNAVRREAYDAAGTHEAFALRPDDDMKLAKLVKRSGFRQEVVFGRGLAEVGWQDDLGSAIRGLEKSAFPGLDYRLGFLLAGSALLVATNVLPFVGVVAGGGTTRRLFAPSVAAVFVAYAAHSPLVDTPPRYAALHPVGTSLFVYATLRSAYQALSNGAIEWRGVSYPLDELRRNVV